MEHARPPIPGEHRADSDLNVLLIEDNPADAYLFKEQLSRVETVVYTLAHVETIEAALEQIGLQPADVLVLDLSLPDAQELEGLRQIRTVASNIPIVVHSGSEDRALIAEAVRQGAQDYLVKGKYDADLLDRVIRYAIERQQSLRVVQESEQRLRSIIEQTSDGVVIVDADDQVVFANPAAEILLDTSQDALLEQPLGFPLATGEATEFEIDRKDGRVVTVEMRVTPITWKGHDAYLASLRDITAHKQLQDQLTAAKEEAEELARMKSAFLASMSHELRTPLTGIMGFADTLAKEIADAQHSEFASMIKQAGERLLATINSVLDLSQLEAGTVKVNNKAVHVTHLVQEVLSLLEPLARKKGLSLGITTFCNETRVHVDKILLQRILDNLIGNAIKFTEEGSVIVEVDYDESHLIIRVKDTGQGIDPIFIPQLFDQFSQESEGLKRSHEGSGLGLAITKKLIEIMGGTISVESTLNVGSTFIISLPCVELSSRPIDVEVGKIHPLTEHAHPHVLVVEDNEQTQQLIKHLLEPTYEVTLVADGATAADLIASSSFDVFLLDIHLDGKQTGIDVLHAARAAKNHRDTPAIAVTAYTFPGDQYYYLEELGFDAFLRKPFTNDQLLEALRHALAAHVSTVDRSARPKTAKRSRDSFRTAS
ncbi:MAG: response regulator [Rhodothermales bacterium]